MPAPSVLPRKALPHLFQLSLTPRRSHSLQGLFTVTDESEEGSAKEGIDGDMEGGCDILLAVEPLSRRDFLGCLQLVHLLSLAS